jgi:FMN-dependent NADH-azoreductase
MANLLQLDSSFAGDHSVSRAVVREYVAEWQARNPQGSVTARDLAAAPPAHLDWTSVSAGMTPAEQRSPEQNEAVKARETLIGEAAAADEIVIAAPMYNFTIPSTLKAWIDQLCVFGVTIADATNPGLFAGKKITFVSSQGGSYAPGTPKDGWDHATPYLTHVAESLGATDVEFINVHMTLSMVNPALAQFQDVFHASRAAATASAKVRAHA